MNNNEATKTYHREDRDLLIQIDTKMGMLMEQFHTHKDSAIQELALLNSKKLSKEEAQKMQQDSDKAHRDYEKRLRRIELHGSIALGVVLAIQAFFGVNIF